MKTLLSIAVAVAFVCANTTTASASINVFNVSVLEGSIPGNNDFKSDLEALGFDSLVEGEFEFTVGGTMFFYYHAAESGFTNSFNIDGTDVFSESNESWSAAGTLIGSITVSAGDKIGTSNLDRLQFTSNNGLDASMGEAGFGIFRTPGGGYVGSDGRFYFGYDDDGAGPDDNHDDMIVSGFFVVPEPGSLAIWAGVAASLVVLRRRRSS